jgi:DNA helicase HerA-like ATPase
MPNEAGATVAQITWIGSERTRYPKGPGGKYDDLIDLPLPLRKIAVSPVGTLTASRGGNTTTAKYELRRGVVAFPSVGDQVLMPTSEQVEAIVGGKAGDRRVRIGTSPLSANAPIMVDPDKLFGRHLAVLGNTGSGKSCTVAGLIRWSLSAAKAEIATAQRSGAPNARFIVLDPNGEYSQAFRDLSTRRFQVDGSGEFRPLKVPAWLWSGEEWAAFTGAAPGIQRPILFDALRRLRSGATEPDAAITQLRGRVKRYRTFLNIRIQQGDHLAIGRREGVAQMLLNLANDFEPLLGAVQDTLQDQIREIVELARTIEIESRANPNNRGGFWHNDFTESRLGDLGAMLAQFANAVGVDNEAELVSEDVPRYFAARELPGFVEALAADATGRDVSQFVDALTLRIRGLFAAGAVASVADPGHPDDVSLSGWLTNQIGSSGAANGEIAIVDLSLVPSEALHIVVAVLSRMIFEAVQRYRRLNGIQLPTVLVLDEAHTFAHKDLTYDGAPASGRVCCRTFEKIAREGRKFGLGLLLASQRPSEMSPTVLSQCNTFLLHRLVNDADQNLVARLVPDNVRGLLRELPSLPSQQAILLGWATPIPVLVEIDSLSQEQRPESADPDYWDVWTLAKERSINWEAIAQEWTGIAGEADLPDESNRRG